MDHTVSREHLRCSSASPVMQKPRSGQARAAGAVAALCACLGLSGCYVVPLQAAPGAPIVPPPGAMAPATPATMTLNARLYPANEQAGRYGMVPATVTTDMNGHGIFSTAIGGESFSGDATRNPGGSRQGQANGSGNRGSFINCQYQMNSAQLGSGQCRMSNGAMFTMHVSG